MPNWIGADSVGLPEVSIGPTRYNEQQFMRGLSQTMLSPFERLLLGENSIAVDNICFRWTPDILLKIRCLSSSAFYAIEAYFCRQWNIYRHLRRWFSDVPLFLGQLQNCDGLISGSEALTFLDHRRFLSKDLDIYLPHHGILAMGRFLKSQGFSFQPSPKDHLWFDATAIAFLTSQHGTEGIQPAGAMSQDSSGQLPKSGCDAAYGVTAFNFVRPIQSDLPTTQGSHVQLIAVDCDPMEYIVNTFHSTGLMNVLTPTHAISLFPRVTFIHEEMYNCRDVSDYPSWTAPWMKKYRDRGFKVFVASDQLPGTRLELVTWKRKVGDTLTWILPYRRKGLTGKAPTLGPYSRYAFEVLDRSLGVAPVGAVSRVGPRFAYSPMAWLRDPSNPTLQATFTSFEVSAAFAECYHTVPIETDDEPSTSDAHTEDEGDTEEAYW